jgi:ubiquitin-associated protein 1
MMKLVELLTPMNTSFNLTTYIFLEKTERQQRIHQRDAARLKQLEDEQKQKLNQVSYPSSDEEDEELANEATNSQNIPREKPFSPTNFNTILMPTQAIMTMQEKKSHRRYASNSSNKIDFSFFESDTSPFDHLEMKSMNEMEVLAQVLGSTPKESGSLERDNSSESESSDQKDNNNVAAPPEPPQVVQQPTQQFQQSFVPYNNYYAAPTSSYYNYPAATNNYGHVNHQNQFLYPQQNYAVNYQYAAAPNNNNIIENGINEKIDAGSKSKSVPSILKELNDELNNSQRRRIRNNSQNSPKEVTEGMLKIHIDNNMIITLQFLFSTTFTSRR